MAKTEDSWIHNPRDALPFRSPPETGPIPLRTDSLVLDHPSLIFPETQRVFFWPLPKRRGAMSSRYEWYWYEYRMQWLGMIIHSWMNLYSKHAILLPAITISQNIYTLAIEPSMKNPKHSLHGDNQPVAWGYTPLFCGQPKMSHCWVYSYMMLHAIDGFIPSFLIVVLDNPMQLMGSILNTLVSDGLVNGKQCRKCMEIWHRNAANSGLHWQILVFPVNCPTTQTYIFSCFLVKSQFWRINQTLILMFFCIFSANLWKFNAPRTRSWLARHWSSKPAGTVELYENHMFLACIDGNGGKTNGIPEFSHQNSWKFIAVHLLRHGVHRLWRNPYPHRTVGHL